MAPAFEGKLGCVVPCPERSVYFPTHGRNVDDSSGFLLSHGEDNQLCQAGQAKNPKIDESKIALIGGSRGGELVLNLASRFDHFNVVIAISTSNITFPAITWSSNTSSWTYKGEEVPYVPAPLKIIRPALKGDLFTAHKMMLEDKEASKKAEIEVKNINGAILILSGKNDDQWPASEMSDQLIQRLKKQKI